MANENWRPGTGQAIPTNTPIKVDPRFTTITPSNPSGYIPFYSGNTGPNKPFYSINNNGVVTFKFGPGPSTQPFQADVENTLNDFAANTKGASTGQGVSNRTDLQATLQANLVAQAPQVGVTPSPTLPPPASPTGQTPGAAASGPNSGITTQFTGVGIERLPEKTFDSGVFGEFSYPSTLNSGQDRVFITQFKYRRSGAIQTEFDFRQTGKGAVTQPLGYVTLPMPNDLSEANSVGWGEDSLSNAAALMMGPLSKGVVSLADANFGQLTDSGTEISKILSRADVGQRVKQVLTANAAASVIKKLGINVNPEAYISRITSAAVNPNLELLFNGPKLRQFSLAYKMVARSQAEAEQIRGILRFFKKGMAPQRSQSTSFYLGTPNVFRVEFKSGNNPLPLKSIGQFKTCALVAFSANYTPDGFYAAYDDSRAGGSQPIAVTMQMGFTELTPVFNDEFNDNDLSDVGPNKFDVNFNKLDLNESTPDATPPPVAGGGQGGRRGSGNSPGGIDPNSTNQLRGRAR
jgi:hypothetical protein